MPAAATARAERDAPGLQRTRGTGALTVGPGASRTRLVRLYQDGAARIQLPNTHDASLQAVLMNTAGGLTGGDALRWTAEARADAHLVLTTPACERIYRSLGPEALVETQLTAGARARLDWLPQETILFAGARLRRRLEIDLAEDSVLLAVEAIVIGRAAMGETAEDARLNDDWRVRRGGRLVHAEATRLTGEAGVRQSPALLAGAGAFATILYVAADAPGRLAAVRAATAGPGLGCSLSGERLVVRALAPTGLALRRAIIPVIGLLSGAGGLPRLWTL